MKDIIRSKVFIVITIIIMGVTIKYHYKKYKHNYKEYSHISDINTEIDVEKVLKNKQDCRDIELYNGHKRNHCNLSIPKKIHRIWFSWDKKNPGLPQLYRKYDTVLKKLHPGWEFVEWGEKDVEKLLKDHYPELLELYNSYDKPIKKHDFSRFIILKHYGGAFIQHSFHFAKNISPLLEGSDFVIGVQYSDKQVKSKPKYKKELLNIAFMASIPDHAVLDELIKSLPKTSKLDVIEATGPKFATPIIMSYLEKSKDDSVAILPNKYIYPFFVSDKTNKKIYKNCIAKHDSCFQLFPEAYAYTIWKMSWTKQNKKSFKLF